MILVQLVWLDGRKEVRNVEEADRLHVLGVDGRQHTFVRDRRRYQRWGSGVRPGRHSAAARVRQNMKLMTPEEITARFERAATDDFNARMVAKAKRDVKGERFIEAKARLRQTLYFLRQFRAVELEHRRKDAELRVNHAEHDRLAGEVYRLGDEIKTIGEAFYYFAWSAREALGQIGIHCEAAGVRNVRNRMIAHPNKPNGVYVSFWSFQSPQGLWLAPFGGVGGGAPGNLDKGLYPNAQEFIEQLLQRVES